MCLAKGFQTQGLCQKGGRRFAKGASSCCNRRQGRCDESYSVVIVVKSTPAGAYPAKTAIVAVLNAA
jgi:hypothetical protein